MENRLDDIDELIGKYLAGEASEGEVARVTNWQNEKEENRYYFNQVRTIFDKASAVKETIRFDEDAAWNKVRAKLRQSNGKVVPFRSQNSFSVVWKIAASILVVLGVGIFAYRVISPAEAIQSVEVVAEKKTVADTLPDGSEVVLNKKTQLTYAFNKKNKEHKVKLKGEAYFNIQHEKRKNFVIEIGEVYIRDIGTAFNVKAYPDSNTIEVVVEEGEVIFYTESDSGVTLKANGKGIYNKSTKKFSIDRPEANVIAYKTKLFVFNGARMAEVVKELNSVYDTKIMISDSLRNCPLTVTFNNESIEEIVAVIGETLGLKHTASAGGILLEGSACQE